MSAFLSATISFSTISLEVVGDFSVDFSLTFDVSLSKACSTTGSLSIVFIYFLFPVFFV